MCIALLSTAHPKYTLLLLSNRDEHLTRPTAQATTWPPPNTHVLAGRDLLRPIQGTWLGITKTGKIAVLTNFREETDPPPNAVSRGAIIRKFLTDEDKTGSTTGDFVREAIDSGIARNAGGFSLVCGTVGEKLAVVSNRADESSQVPWICGDVVQTVGLSNAAFSDRSWKKVRDGEEFVLDVIRKSIAEGYSEDRLIDEFLGVLSRDTLTRVETEDQDDGLATYVKELRNTIFVPALGRKNMERLRADEYAAARKAERAEVVANGDLATHADHANNQELGVSGLYGTQKQTVVLVDHDMNVRFFERTLFDDTPNPIPIGEGDVDIRFRIQK